MTRFWTLILMAGLLAACVPAGTGVLPTSAPDTLTPAAPNTLVRETPAPAAASPQPSMLATASSSGAASGKGMGDGPILVVQRSGGLAGVSEEWSIYADGRVITPTGARKVESEQIARLLSSMISSGLFALNESSGVVFSKCRDCFTYQITVAQGGKMKTFQVQPEATDTPIEAREALQSIIDFLNTLPKG